MAIDTSLYVCQIPAAAYAKGDKIQMGCIRGPSVVRDGYGSAILKRILTIADATAVSGYFKVVIKNSNWVDEMSNPEIAAPSAETVLSPNSSSVQQGQNLPLVPNSGWDIYAECISAVTTTAGADIFTLIDIDYPKVAAIEDPSKVIGYPVTIDGDYTVTPTAAGSAATMAWNTINVDKFKAGYKYLLTEASFSAFTSATLGFMSISGASGQAGLERIIPCRAGASSGLRYPIDYATPLVKGPMNLNFALIGSATTVYAYMDFVKKAL